MENAWLDTTLPVPLPPPGLRAEAEPGAYLIQSRRPLDAAFRKLLAAAGVEIISYVPNQACLVRANAPLVAGLRDSPLVSAVLPYEPYYKLKGGLLALAHRQGTLPGGSRLNLLLFPDANAVVRAELLQQGLRVTGTEGSPFGPVLQVVIPASVSPGLLSALARLPGVQALEWSRSRRPATDLARVTIGVADSAMAADNYLGLSGANVLVALNDTGVDGAHPDLAGRVTGDSAGSLQDVNGHGTHVAGIIAGSGLGSPDLTNVAGSFSPSAPGQFRGMAPRARIFATAGGSDGYLQQAAALTNALISNNSWTYGVGGYDLAAASYDAAVRDAAAGTPGQQPVIFVFAAGNAGEGDDDGTAGSPDSVLSPATAKNVLTVGALEQERHLTNTVICWSTNGSPHWQTNSPWLELTSARGRVAGFSSRGNVGVGVEGDFGRFKPDLVAPGVFVVGARPQAWDQASYYSASNAALAFATPGNTLEVLSNLNDGLAAPPQLYRYESGTSLAAGCVAGTLALVQEFFEQRLGGRPSPALMKALLINGARPLASSAGLGVASPLNLQGWGALSLMTTLPAALTNTLAPTAATPMAIFDQNSAGALATGQSATRWVTLSSPAQSTALRVTLVWTDPPGNPLAGVKLVNDLDLLVTNLDTGQIYLGNDIAAGSFTNSIWDPQTAPRADRVNNVENVLLEPQLGTHYSVTVRARAVNMNAVGARDEAAVQDYALVIASGDGGLADALLVDGPVLTLDPGLQLSLVTNQFSPGMPDAGGILLGQRAGASSSFPKTNAIPFPSLNGAISLGDTNQWHFYVVPNDAGYPNAAFLTFSARRLAPDGLAGGWPAQAMLSTTEADIDLYVSLEPGLTNLDPAVLGRADKSVARGGTEFLVYTNASLGPYYVGVKCESRQGAEFGFAAVVSPVPFSQVDTNGAETLRGFPAPALLPAAADSQPGAGRLLALAAQTGLVHRVIVTNTLTHPTVGDLVGSLSHLATQSILNDHATNPPVLAQPFVYDDSAENDIPGAQPSDGPGHLNWFGNLPSAGVWMLEEVDAVSAAPGTDDSLFIRLEPQPDPLAGFTAAILPGACRRDYLAVPPAATNLAAAVSLLAGSGPLAINICPTIANAGPAQACSASTNAGGWLVLDKTVTPPLNAGLYVLSVSNLGPDSVTVTNWVTLGLLPGGLPPLLYVSTGAVSLADTAITVAPLGVPDDRKVVTAEVGVRIDHPRVSDLVIHLVSPAGTRVLLAENRGGMAADGMGQNIIVTNLTPVSSSGGPAAYTNVLNTGQTSGSISISYNFYAVPDNMRVFYDGALIYDSGLVSFSGLTNIDYGPGSDTQVTIIMNQGGNINPDDAWDYTVTATQPGFLYTTFTEDTNLTITPIKFAVPPFTSNSLAPGGGLANGIFYLPEQSLGLLAGENAAGEWRLEVEDTQAGPAGGSATLLGWQLALRLADSVPTPIALVQHQPHTVTLAAGKTQYFAVNVPAWATLATNTLLFADAALSVVFNASEPPDVTLQPDDFVLLANVTHGVEVLAAGALPPALDPGTRFYLAVQNTNAAAVNFAFQVDFDVPVLADGIATPVALATDSQPRYFAYEVSTNATLMVLSLQVLTADADVYAQFGLPFPAPGGNAMYASVNPGTNDEQILVFTNSLPPLQPGRWYFGVFNSDTTNVAGTLVANQFSVYGTNTSILACQVVSNALCLTWASSPGNLYHVLAAPGLSAGGALAPLSPTLMATDLQTTFSTPLAPSPRTIVVVDGPSPGDSAALPAISAPVITSTGILLQWAAAANSRFQVQWTPSLGNPAWTTLPGVLTSVSGTFSFLDDGSQTGGLDTARFYRLLVVP